MRKTLIKRKKTSNKKTSKSTRKNCKRGGGKEDRALGIRLSSVPYKRPTSGSDIRNQLVTFCRQGEWEKYDDITQQIIKDYRDVRPNKEFFNHLKNQIKIIYKEDGNPSIESTTFSDNTLLCLERSLTQLQEDGIPESMVYLHVISDIARKLRA
jgi:hypothetical protein